MRHVKIKVDEQAISTGLVTARRFTPGEVVVPQEPAASRILTSLLACLGAKSDWEEVEMSKRKTLKLGFVIEQDQHGWHELRNFLKGDHDDVRSEMMSFLILAKGVEKRRNVEVDLELMHKGDSRGKISLLELDLDLGSRWGRRWRG